MSDNLGKGAGDYMTIYRARMFANNTDPDAVANLVRQLEACDKGDPVEAVTGTIGAPLQSVNLLEQMEKFNRLMRASTTPREPMAKVVLGTDAMAELRRICGPTTRDAPGPRPSDPMGVITGIQVVESQVLESDQWIAYDRNGKILAMGRINSIRLLGPERTYITTDPATPLPTGPEDAAAWDWKPKP